MQTEPSYGLSKETGRTPVGDKPIVFEFANPIIRAQSNRCGLLCPAQPDCVVTFVDHKLTGLDVELARLANFLDLCEVCHALCSRAYPVLGHESDVCKLSCGGHCVCAAEWNLVVVGNPKTNLGRLRQESVFPCEIVDTVLGECKRGAVSVVPWSEGLCYLADNLWLSQAVACSKKCGKAVAIIGPCGKRIGGCREKVSDVVYELQVEGHTQTQCLPYPAFRTPRTLFRKSGCIAAPSRGQRGRGLLGIWVCRAGGKNEGSRKFRLNPSVPRRREDSLCMLRTSRWAARQRRLGGWPCSVRREPWSGRTLRAWQPTLPCTSP